MTLHPPHLLDRKAPDVLQSFPVQLVFSFLLRLYLSISGIDDDLTSSPGKTSITEEPKSDGKSGCRKVDGSRSSPWLGTRSCFHDQSHRLFDPAPHSLLLHTRIRTCIATQSTCIPLTPPLLAQSISIDIPFQTTSLLWGSRSQHSHLYRGQLYAFLLVQS